MLNKIMIIGRLGSDPEIRYMKSGEPMANFSVATTETWKNKKTKEPEERTDWHRCVIFGKLAEIAGEYLKKGNMVYLEGKMRYRTWTDEDGIDHYFSEVTLSGWDSKMVMLGGGKNGEKKTAHPSTQNSEPSRSARSARSDPQAPPQDFDDDIPF